MKMKFVMMALVLSTMAFSGVNAMDPATAAVTAPAVTAPAVTAPAAAGDAGDGVGEPAESAASAGGDGGAAAPAVAREVDPEMAQYANKETARLWSSNLKRLRQEHLQAVAEKAAADKAAAAKELRNLRIKQGAGAAVLAWLLADLGIGAYKANKGFNKLSKEDRKVMKFLSMVLNEMYTVKGVKAGGRLAKRAGSGLARSVRAGYNGTKSFFSKKNRASNVEANAIAA